VLQDLAVGATGVFEGVRKNRYTVPVELPAGHDAVLVDGFGEPDDEGSLAPTTGPEVTCGGSSWPPPEPEAEP
jgi:hypothetical protein